MLLFSNLSSVNIWKIFLNVFSCFYFLFYLSHISVQLGGTEKRTIKLYFQCVSLRIFRQCYANHKTENNKKHLLKCFAVAAVFFFFVATLFVCCVLNVVVL